MGGNPLRLNGFSWSVSRFPPFALPYLFMQIFFFWFFFYLFFYPVFFFLSFVLLSHLKRMLNVGRRRRYQPGNWQADRFTKDLYTGIGFLRRFDSEKTWDLKNHSHVQSHTSYTNGIWLCVFDQKKNNNQNVGCTRRPASIRLFTRRWRSRWSWPVKFPTRSAPTPTARPRASPCTSNDATAPPNGFTKVFPYTHPSGPSLRPSYSLCPYTSSPG